MDVAKLIEDEYGPRIRACGRLFEYAKGLSKSWTGRPFESTAEGMILALFSRSLDTYKSAVLLASEGYGVQASMLNRSLFEDMIDAHWIATDPGTAEQRYQDHHQHHRMLLADAVRKYPEQYAKLELPEFEPEERKRLDGVYGVWGSKSWSGIGLHERVHLVDHHWTDDASRSTLWQFHDFSHRENNQTLHVSSASLNASVLLFDDELTFRVGPRPDMLDKALFGSFWIFQNTIGLIHDQFEIELDDGRREEVFGARDFVKLSEEQLRHTGRNDPCPCGSGQKFKRCHGA